MSFMEKIKGIISIPEDDYYDDREDDYMDYQQPVRNESTAPERAPHTPPRAAAPERDKDNKVMSIHTTAQLQVVLVKPERFEDASGIADHLNDKRTVVLNLESANREVARRLVDFLSGVAYANGGQIKRVANSTFIITPYNVDVMGDLLDELENNGMFF